VLNTQLRVGLGARQIKVKERQGEGGLFGERDEKKGQGGEGGDEVGVYLGSKCRLSWSTLSRGEGTRLGQTGRGMGGKAGIRRKGKGEEGWGLSKKNNSSQRKITQKEKKRPLRGGGKKEQRSSRKQEKRKEKKRPNPKPTGQHT